MTTPQQAAKGKTPEATANSNMMEVLENTLWNRSLGSMSEEIVAALVCQIFEGERMQMLRLPFAQAAPCLMRRLQGSWWAGGETP